MGKKPKKGLRAAPASAPAASAPLTDAQKEDIKRQFAALTAEADAPDVQARAEQGVREALDKARSRPTARDPKIAKMVIK